MSKNYYNNINFEKRQKKFLPQNSARRTVSIQKIQEKYQKLIKLGENNYKIKIVVT